MSLAPLLTDEKSDWPGMMQALSKNVKQPEGMDRGSEDFNRWARCLVEIHLPSPTLARGIDVYNTPGLLIGEAPVFSKILRDLVELIHSTIVFIYGNPSTDDTTRACFVAMKAALHDIDHNSFFFFISKADLDRMQEGHDKWWILRCLSRRASPVLWTPAKCASPDQYYSGSSPSIDRPVSVLWSLYCAFTIYQTPWFDDEWENYREYYTIRSEQQGHDDETSMPVDTAHCWFLLATFVCQRYSIITPIIRQPI